MNFVLLFLSLFGWGMFTYNKLKIHSAFIPIFIFSTITCLVFLSGLLNIMPIIVYSIFYLGLVLCFIYIYFIIKKKYPISILAKDLLVPATVFFIISLITVIFMLRGIIYIHYDNFSHWGLIVKEMFRIDGLPDGTTLVSFRNYPPGSAVFIYFILKIIKYTESHALMAQGFLIVSNLSVLFVFCRWKYPGHILLSLSSSIVLVVVIKMNIYNLLVDTLLPLLAISIAVISFYYRDEWKKILLVNAPLLILLLLIKDSGKLFLVMNFILIISLIYSNSIRGKILKCKIKIFTIALVFTLCIPLSANFLWVKYTEKAYPTESYESNKFALSSEKLANTEKTDDFRKTLDTKILEASTDIDSKNFKSVLVLNSTAIIMMLLIYIRTKKLSKMLLFSMIFVNIYYWLYILSLYYMYLYLMPEAEASFLAGFKRYQSTIVLYFNGLLMTAIILEGIKYISYFKMKITKIVVYTCLISIFIFPFYKNLILSMVRPDVETKIRYDVRTSFSSIVGQGLKDPNVIYYSPKSIDDAGYLIYVALYEQLSKKYSIVKRISNKSEEEAFTELIKNSNYLVILDSDKSLENYLVKMAGIKNPEGIYKLSVKGDNITFTPLP